MLITIMIFTVRIILTMLIKTNVFFIQIAFTRVMKTKNDVNSAGHFQLKERQPRSHGNEVALAEFFLVDLEKWRKILHVFERRKSRAFP